MITVIGGRIIPTFTARMLAGRAALMQFPTSIQLRPIIDVAGVGHDASGIVAAGSGFSAGAWLRHSEIDRAARKTEFAADSALEGAGFEPSVTLLRKALLVVANRRRRQGAATYRFRSETAMVAWSGFP
jgi:hypothetical protein